MTTDDNEIIYCPIHCPSVDVCAWCTDCECDGIGCITSLDPNDSDDHGAIDHLHAVIRAGKVLLQANAVLAEAEVRWAPATSRTVDARRHREQKLRDAAESVRSEINAKVIPVAELRRWAEQREAEAKSGYTVDGRGGYGDIAGAIEVCQELLQWCHEIEDPTP